MVSPYNSFSELDQDITMSPNSAGKRLFVCCDGTKNDSIKDKHENHTNVAKFGRCIAPVDSKGVQQIVYYHKGPVAMMGLTGGGM
jgi:uncharacterized protein (DUF2235 family)